MASDNPAHLPEPEIAIVSITANGVRLALQIQGKLPGSVCYAPARHRFATAMGARPFHGLAAIFPEMWRRHQSLICIMATGIVVRLAAPLLRGKTEDRAVVVLDERGQFAISLVSGHLGGANALAASVAGITGGRAVITTSSDVCGKPAIDLIARDAGLEVGNPPMLSRLARAILEDEPFWLFDPGNLLAPSIEDRAGFSKVDLDFFGASGQPPAPDNREGAGKALPLDLQNGTASGQCPPSPEESGRESMASARCTRNAGRDSPMGNDGAPEVSRSNIGVWVSESEAPKGFKCLALHPRRLVVGIGCNRGTGAAEILDLLRSVFSGENLSLLSIRNLASIDLKADEPGLLEAAEAIGRPIVFFAREEVENITVPNPSSMVEKHLGVQSVCEATALLSARATALIVPKRKSPNATLAVARANSPS